MQPSRRAELKASLARVRARIDAACDKSERASTEVTLIVVTKFFPASDVLDLLDLGVRDIGESRDQEASAKLEAVRKCTAGDDLPTVHMIGQVQTKKARSIVRYTDVVHSLDRVRLAHALDRATARAIAESERGTPMDVTVQVDLSEVSNEQRGGVKANQVPELADAIAECASLRLCGVMAIAPAEAVDDEVALHTAFERLTRCRDEILRSHPGAQWLSAGMSSDLEPAIAAGATHLRVGSAILGSRPPQR